MRIYLAATTNGMNKELRDNTVKECQPLYMLETFFEGEKVCKKVLNDVGKENFLLDSGAFSYMNGVTVTKEGMEQYIEKYIDFINKYDIPYFFEIDVDVIFGLEMVEYWRGQIEKETNKKCIPVWHKSRGVDYWKRMCQEYKYIAIGGLVLDFKKQEFENLKPMIKYANNRGVRVHGLGFTKTSILREFPFYSVDSSSWVTSGVRGQRIYTYSMGELISRRIDSGGKKVKLEKLAAHNMIEWTKYQKFMDKIRI